MSKLIDSIGKTILDGVTGMLFENRDGLVKLFETEYQKEYRHALKSGAVINDEFVRKFLGYDRINQ
jgi:hypothetical protein